MSMPSCIVRASWGRRLLATSALALCVPLGTVAADPDHGPRETIKTETPIKHVIVVIGENRTFDHVYGTYLPHPGQTIRNLLSEGIVRPDGSSGPNFAASRQFTTGPEATYYVGVAAVQKTAYSVLPPPTLGGAPNQPSPTSPPFSGLSQQQLAAIEPSLEPEDLVLLTTGATGAATTSGAPDTRIANFANLPDGSFQLTGPHLPYDSYTGDTTHRFYQMWQQSDCSAANARPGNPTGCLNDLYPFVITTYAGPTADKGGGTSMAFFNMQTGDAPLFKKLADEFTINDNYHQPGQGGTGIQHVFMGAGDDIFWSDGAGTPTVPPASQIANPNPKPTTNNRYTVDGRFSDCSNTLNPGVAPIVSYLATLPYEVGPNCAVGHYYMLNNTNPGFLPNGQVDTAGIASGGSIPPSNVRTIGDALNDKKIGWAYYGGAYNAAVNLANGSTNPADAVGAAYCNICNFESYATSIMGNPAQRQVHIKDATDFFAAVQQGNLPSVSFVKPDGLLDGHPATSKLDLFEGMLQKILDTLDRNPKLKAETAVFITFDEGGGYYDSGYIQPLDFFGDGPRIPLVVVSPFSHGGKVVHSYNDHASILKFIERNWGLSPLTGRSRDNLPNPVTNRDDPYLPTNSPAIGDLFDMFHFDGDKDEDRS
ncbi:MAG: phosphoesterase [Alphaproteobacteria bacterium]|nr:phosphoesterase [Alphaproteobacteria bacterium]MBV9152709.1 phosphoesterase [Alphaproteobacteria bacterium]